MFYQGKYCCKCGTQIERVEKGVFTSRKFCELCETDFKFEKILVMGAGFLLLVFGITGISSLLFQSDEALVVKENSTAEVTGENNKRSLKSHNLPLENANKDEDSVYESNNVSVEKPISEQNVLPEREAKSSKSVKDTQNSPVEAVYYCGAETKKGTPCSRPKKGGGRCWQHVGREAMLPQKDLLIKGR